jgi:hypothetical protein
VRAGIMQAVRARYFWLLLHIGVVGVGLVMLAKL